jgi:hypothetical protein
MTLLQSGYHGHAKSARCLVSWPLTDTFGQAARASQASLGLTESQAAFILSFLTKLAQSEFELIVTIKAAIGPDTDGGFCIFQRGKSNDSACSTCFKRRRG